MASKMRIGTRGSPLALAQASETRARLAAAHGWDIDEIENVIIRTSGDRIQDVALREVGGKELFTREIEAALEEDRIDLAVHSAKDVETEMAEGLAIVGALPRADVRDAFISPVADHPSRLPKNAIVGTASLRRAALLKRMRPDLRTVLLRGNVGTRLRKLEAGDMQATLLASAGLNRLNLADRATALLDTAEFPPSPGQGTICLQARAVDEVTRERVSAIDDAATSSCLAVERAFLAALGGSCHTPVAGHAALLDGQVHFAAIVLTPNGDQGFEDRWEGPQADAEASARRIGATLREACLGVVDLD